MAKSTKRWKREDNEESGSEWSSESKSGSLDSEFTGGTNGMDSGLDDNQSFISKNDSLSVEDNDSENSWCEDQSIFGLLTKAKGSITDARQDHLLNH